MVKLEPSNISDQARNWLLPYGICPKRQAAVKWLARHLFITTIPSMVAWSAPCASAQQTYAGVISQLNIWALKLMLVELIPEAKPRKPTKYWISFLMINPDYAEYFLIVICSRSFVILLDENITQPIQGTLFDTSRPWRSLNMTMKRGLGELKAFYSPQWS